MCGIVGAVADRNVPAILLEGLNRLEYRGYDSAGLAVIDGDGELSRRREAGKVQSLARNIAEFPIAGHVGIAHTRWATHGAPSEKNAHPHRSNRVCVVHNGIIENYEILRDELQAAGYRFESETDSETVAHLVDYFMVSGLVLLDAVRATLKRLEGAYAIGVICSDDPGRIIAARSGSPLVIGKGIGENFIASDVLALKPVTDRFVFLEEGDLVELRKDSLSIWNIDDQSVVRADVHVEMSRDDVDKGNYRHHMLKEIFEQPKVINQTLEGRLGRSQVLEPAFGVSAKNIFDGVQAVTIVACGTSFYAASVARYWIEELVGIPCQVEIASEFRYRPLAVLPQSLFVTISQSGETADTLAALRYAQSKDYLSTLSICNVPTSSLARESEHVLFTNAGPEIGVASTKAFTTQLAGLMLLAMSIAKSLDVDKGLRKNLASELRALPEVIKETLKLSDEILSIVPNIADKHNALFLGRGMFFPIVQEGALKLKEISYIHAEAYPAGELKHGPLALVDDQIPVVALSPENTLTEKLVSNLEEVKARGGTLYVFGGPNAKINLERGAYIQMPECSELLAPIIYTIPLQILAYQVACQRGTDLDQPRNLAKSVTVE